VAPAAAACNATGHELQVIPGHGSSKSRNNSSSGGSSSSHSRAQPPTAPRPASVPARLSRHHVSTSAGGCGSSSAAGRSSSSGGSGSGSGVSLTESSRHPSDWSSGSDAAAGSSAQVQFGSDAGAVSGHEGTAAAAAATPSGSHASSNGSRSSSEGGVSTAGSTAAVAPQRYPASGDSSPMALIAAAVLSPISGAAAAAAADAVGAAIGGSSRQGGSSAVWEPEHFHTAAELLSPPSTCKAARGSQGGASRRGDVSLMVRPLSDEMLTGENFTGYPCMCCSKAAGTGSVTTSDDILTKPAPSFCAADATYAASTACWRLAL
jgi:hypothetical protein